MRASCGFVVGLIWFVGMCASASGQPKLPKGILLEEAPTDTKKAKVVLIAGSNYFKPGEHDYVAGCALLADLLRQSPGIHPVFALDWPAKAETFKDAKAVVFFADGGDKHGMFVKPQRAEQMQSLIDAGCGVVLLHQGIDVSRTQGDRLRAWTGAAWEKGFSQRAHWIARFDRFGDHPIFRGVEPFQIDDGWLFKLRFTKELKGMTPLLRTVSPKAKGKSPEDESIVSWAAQRAGGGRSVVFTGGHLHASFAQEGYRRFLVNSILWTAQQPIPAAGAPVQLRAEDLAGYLQERPIVKGK